ncbi:MAG: IS3 family transposase [Woeseia sp.]|nr:IS3 family transposase [Woeseia sp.]
MTGLINIHECFGPLSNTKFSYLDKYVRAEVDPQRHPDDFDPHQKAWPINLMCKVLGVSRSKFHHWKGRGPSPQVRSNKELDNRIRERFTRHKQRYGAPRITDNLHDECIACSENRVARRMRLLGLRAIQAKKFKVTTDSNHSKPVAPELIEQDFTTEVPNEKWLRDIIYVRTDEGWLYLAVVMNLYSRAIVGW